MNGTSEDFINFSSDNDSTDEDMDMDDRCNKSSILCEFSSTSDNNDNADHCVILSQDDVNEQFISNTSNKWWTRRSINDATVPTTNVGRFLLKGELANMFFSHVPGYIQNSIQDIFTTFVEMRWRWVIVNFIWVSVLMFIVFALYYYFFDKIWTTHECITNTETFLDALLFSIETQTTIGYGYRSLDTCISGTIGVILQSILGMVLELVLSGVVIAKTRHPHSRKQSVIFARKACVSDYDGKRRLLIRVGDIQRSEVFNVRITGNLVPSDLYKRSQMWAGCRQRVVFFSESNKSELMLPWPTFAIHTIDRDSPFWEMNAKDFQSPHYEMLIAMEAIVGITSNNLQVRTSYLPADILWGHSFRNIDCYSPDGSITLDFSLFNETVYKPVTSNCSAATMDKFQRLVAKSLKYSRSHSQPMTVYRYSRQNDVLCKRLRHYSL